MRITFIREGFLKSASVVTQVIGYKPSLPVLGNLLLKAGGGYLEITGTNLEETIQTKIPVKVQAEGETTVSARLLVEFCQNTKVVQVELYLDKDSLILDSGTARAKIPTISPQEFPSVGEFEKGDTLVISNGDFQDSVGQVAFCAAPEEGRPVLTGVLLNSGSSRTDLVATDGYRLGKKELEIKAGVKAIIPAKALREAAKAVADSGEDEVELLINKSGNQARINTKNLSVTTRLIDGDYPNYEQIIPSAFTTEAVVDKEEMASAIKLTALFAKDVGNVVKLSITKDNIQVSASTAQVGEAETAVAGKISGDAMQIAFNSRFFTDSLAALKSKEIHISFSGPTTAAMLRGKDDKGLMYIVMPVRTQG